MRKGAHHTIQTAMTANDNETNKTTKWRFS